MIYILVEYYKDDIDNIVFATTDRSLAVHSLKIYNGIKGKVSCSEKYHYKLEVWNDGILIEEDYQVDDD